MITLNTDHPHYDLSMEVLATLRPWPEGVVLRELAEDFGFADQFQLSAAIVQLRQRGFHVDTWKENGRRQAALQQTDWRRAQQAAREYVKKAWT